MENCTSREIDAEKGVLLTQLAERTAHFAKVEKIDGESGINVISKFGSQHIYRHRVGVTQFHCGNSVTFLNFPQK